MTGIGLLHGIHGQRANGVGDGRKNGRSHVQFSLVAECAASPLRVESFALKEGNYQPNGVQLARHFLLKMQIFNRQAAFCRARVVWQDASEVRSVLTRDPVNRHVA